MLLECCSISGNVAHNCFIVKDKPKRIWGASSGGHPFLEPIEPLDCEP